VASAYGIREGLLLETARVAPVVSDPGDARERSVREFAERCHYEEPHSRQVQRLALQLATLAGLVVAAPLPKQLLNLTLLTSAALTMASLIGGAVVIESVFALNGFGMFLAMSIVVRQYLAIQSLVAIVAIAFILFNLIVDVLYAVIDPRVRNHRGA
jgi:hypothetical protein